MDALQTSLHSSVRYNIYGKQNQYLILKWTNTKSYNILIIDPAFVKKLLLSEIIIYDLVIEES